MDPCYWDTGDPPCSWIGRRMPRPTDAPPPVLALLYAPAGSALVERADRLLVAVPEVGDRVVVSREELLAAPTAQAAERLLALVA